MKERLPPKDQLIMGLQTLEETLRHAPKRLLKVFTDASIQSGSRKANLLQRCKELHLPIQRVTPELLEKMAGSDSHQSFVAQIQGRHFYKPQEFLTKHNPSFLLMLDSIHDPQNFGAILRSAECFGVDGVI